MGYVPDLSERPVSNWETIVHVGWLAVGHRFTTGAVSPEFVEALRRLLMFPDAVSAGRHRCEFCQEGQVAGRTDAANAWSSARYGSAVVSARGARPRRYYAPSLIGHYVVEHGYQPPQEFIEAVVRAWRLPSSPRAFGYKCAWVAVRDATVADVAAALPLADSTECPWSTGIDLAYKGYVFVAPPVDGWTLAAGTTLADSYRLHDRSVPVIDRLAPRFREVQYFASHRVTESHAWSRAIDGRTVRRFAYIGETFDVPSNDGAMTDVERSLGLTLEPPFPKVGEFPNEDAVMRVAGSWSLDPQSLEGRAEPSAFGLVGRLA